MDSEIIAAFIGPVFTAMIAGIGILLKSIQVRHREQNARARDLEVATRTVSFIATYLSAQDKLIPKAEQEFVRERAMRDLEVAYQTMMATANADYQNDSTGSWIRVIKRALLIPLHRTGAKVVRVFYYITVVVGLLFFTVLMATSFTDPEILRDVPLLITMILMSIVINFLPMVLLYIWARWLDRDRTALQAPQPLPGADPMVGHYGWQPVPNGPGQPYPGPAPGQMPGPPGQMPGYPPR